MKPVDLRAAGHLPPGPQVLQVPRQRSEAPALSGLHAAHLPLRRLPDWQLRMAALVEDRLHAPFVWGARDCCLWAADVVHAVTGVDFGAPYRGTYSTQAEAAAIFRAVRGWPRLCSALLGPAIAPAMAQPGDVGLVDSADGPALAAHVGGAWMSQGPEGLLQVDPQYVVQAWRCCAW
jgi:hypothetical protein